MKGQYRDFTVEYEHTDTHGEYNFYSVYVTYKGKKSQRMYLWFPGVAKDGDETATYILRAILADASYGEGPFENFKLSANANNYVDSLEKTYERYRDVAYKLRGVYEGPLHEVVWQMLDDGYNV